MQWKKIHKYGPVVRINNEIELEFENIFYCTARVNCNSIIIIKHTQIFGV